MTEYLSTDKAYEKDSTDAEITLPDGPTATINVKDATLEEIESFEEREEGENDLDLIQDVFDNYLVEPEGLNARKMPMPKVEAIMTGVFKAWGVSEDDLDDLISDRQGN